MNNNTIINAALTREQLCDIALACIAAKSRANDGGEQWDDLYNTIRDIIRTADTTEAATEAAPVQDPAPADQAEAETAQEAPAADTTETTTETENAPQAATQTTEAAMHAATAAGIIRRKGGYRDRDLLSRPHTIERGTWTAEHKVVEILATEADPDGYRAGCAVDIVTRAIVG